MTKDLENKVSKIKEFFNQLEFEESTHTYKVLGEQLSSASSTISNFYDPFDTYRVAGFVAKKRGITKEEVLKEWDDKRDFACHKGHVVHAFGEDYMFDRTREKDYPEFSGYMDAIINFWDSLPSHIVPAIAELKMYSKQFNLAGTADIILYDKNRKGFIIADYKTNIDLFKNFKNKKLKAPFNNLLECPMSKYKVQLSIYHYLFEQTGFKILDRVIIWLKEDGSFEKYHTEDLTNKIKTYLTDEKQRSNSKNSAIIF